MPRNPKGGKTSGRYAEIRLSAAFASAEPVHLRFAASAIALRLPALIRRFFLTGGAARGCAVRRGGRAWAAAVRVWRADCNAAIAGVSSGKWLPIMDAAMVDYTLYLAGKKTIYNGRTGDFHIEHFPAARP